jgi:hypothetical protein
METFVTFVIFCELSVLRFNFAPLRLCVRFFFSSFLVRFAPFVAIPVSPSDIVERSQLLSLKTQDSATRP